MSAQAMLSLVVDLNIQPGEIPPTIRLKKSSNSMNIRLRIAAEGTDMETEGTAILKVARSENADVFAVLPISDITSQSITVDLVSEQIALLTAIPGTFEGTISIIDSENQITQADYEEYDLITVQPFTLAVEKSAAE